MVIGQLDTPAGPVVVANTHLSFVPGWGRRQLYRIRRDLSTVEGPVLLMGDLNMAGNLPSKITGYRSLARHPTFPLDSPTASWTTSCSVVNLAEVTHQSAPALPLSDHRALIVDLDPTTRQDGSRHVDQH